MDTIAKDSNLPYLTGRLDSQLSYKIMGCPARRELGQLFLFLPPPDRDLNS
jgi:hypothetical protein